MGMLYWLLALDKVRQRWLLIEHDNVMEWALKSNRGCEHCISTNRKGGMEGLIGGGFCMNPPRH